jgi:hypothetical protein
MNSLQTPGAGRFTIEELGVSAQGRGARLTGRLSGGNIAYIYYEVLRKDPDGDRYYGPVVREHVKADRDSETGGVVRPRWSDPIDIALELSPNMRLLTDGTSTAFCFAVPTGYDTRGYRVEGRYLPAGEADPIRAECVFSDSGVVARFQVRGGEGRPAAPRAFFPKRGDQFTPVAQVLTRSKDGEDSWSTEVLPTPLTFGEEPLSVVLEGLSPGDYLAGIIAQDLDGALTRRYAPLEIDT